MCGEGCLDSLFTHTNKSPQVLDDAEQQRCVVLCLKWLHSLNNTGKSTFLLSEDRFFLNKTLAFDHLCLFFVRLLELQELLLYTVKKYFPQTFKDQSNQNRKWATLEEHSWTL